jgi:hypothetical protein
MSKKIKMHVDGNGVTKIEAEGYEGGTCLDATSIFEGIFSKTETPREMVGECAGANHERGERVR